MKKIAVMAIVVALGMSMLAPGARAGTDSTLRQPPEQAQNDHDFAVGNINHLGTINGGVSAHSGSAGEDPSGHVSFKRTDPEQEIRGPVTCLHVSGNEAFIRYLVEKSNLPVFFPEGQEAYLHVVDNGIPDGGAPKDLVATLPGSFAPPSPGFPCGSNPFALPLDNGNITINDA